MFGWQDPSAALRAPPRGSPDVAGSQAMGHSSPLQTLPPFAGRVSHDLTLRLSQRTWSQVQEAQGDRSPGDTDTSASPGHGPQSPQGFRSGSGSVLPRRARCRAVCGAAPGWPTRVFLFLLIPPHPGVRHQGDLAARKIPATSLCAGGPRLPTGISPGTSCWVENKLATAPVGALTSLWPRGHEAWWVASPLPHAQPSADQGGPRGKVPAALCGPFPYPPFSQEPR